MYRSRELSLTILMVVLALTTLLPAGVRASTPTVDGAWSALDASVPAPSPRREYAAVLDYPRSRYIIFGGFGFGALKFKSFFSPAKDSVP